MKAAMQSVAPNGPLITNVQVLRFVAAAWVMFLHAKGALLFGDLTPEMPRLLSAIQKAGFVGVDVFFVISGVIMALTTQSNPPSWRVGLRFALTRYVRIYCGWWPFFLLYLLSYALMGRLSGEQRLLGSFFLVPMGLNAYLVPVVWTLSFELYFYAFVAVLLLFEPRQRVAIVVVTGSALAAFVLWSAWQGFYTPARFGETWPLQQFVAFPLVAEFLAGFLLLEWVRLRKPRAAWPWLIGAAVFFALALYFQKSVVVPGADGLEGFFYSPWRALLVGGFAVCLVAAALIARPMSGLCGRVMARLGDASYAIYLSHMLVLMVVSWLFMRWGWPAAWRAWAYVATLACVVAYSYLHFRYIEHPLYRLARSAIERRF